MRFVALALALSASGLCLGDAAIAAPAAAKTPFPKALPEESIPAVTKLPAQWPASWVLIHDFHFNAIVDGRVMLVDTTSADRPVKGMVRAAQFANMLVSPTRGEVLTSETFYSRLTRGERTDAVTIWDMATLQPKGEIVLPGGKRQQSVTYPQLFQFTNADKWALVANFTPAQSVSVLDLDARKVIAEIDLPGCAQIYPTGERGFSSFCADGSLFSVKLGPDGQAVSSKSVDKVQDIDNQPLFSTPAWVGKTAWFVSYRGQIQALDFSGEVGKPLAGSFNVGNAEGATPEWRPGGWQVIAADAAGKLYILMSPAGREGSHKDGGTEVWVVDPVAKARTARISLRSVATAISLTKEAQPRLIVARGDGEVDVHDPVSGAFLRSLGAAGGSNPILITAP
ncbi:amine dehydrogenase large subunit [Novosphingobium taihuense]|uniref:Methylamine dehydrogenase heavy chain n=1 Tax=Novosphingobium taihuense TaxID=260085 RepID=A0A7W7ETN0_9SPHN|nr:amine dehydrogenase large subunit [Novosphingobium taihuense]MBB4613548.1 methylamine dehydrogenase heavy chain [Novosphingobium taihuense]TWH81208.1 methylamine dehydrogenase heavy chain [Novosphingobium taihuense]